MTIIPLGCTKENPRLGTQCELLGTEPATIFSRQGTIRASGSSRVHRLRGGECHGLRWVWRGVTHNATSPRCRRGNRRRISMTGGMIVAVCKTHWRKLRINNRIVAIIIARAPLTGCPTPIPVPAATPPHASDQNVFPFITNRARASNPRSIFMAISALCTAERGLGGPQL